MYVLYIKWPNATKQANTSAEFQNYSGLGGVIGDECRDEAIKQSTGNAQDYYNRKQFDFIILHGACDAECLVDA